MCKQIDHFPEDADYEADASEYFLRESVFFFLPLVGFESVTSDLKVIFHCSCLYHELSEKPTNILNEGWKVRMWAE